MWRRRSANVNEVSSLAHRIRVSAPATKTEARTVPSAAVLPVSVEPDVTRDLYQRVECIVEASSFSPADEAAMRHVLARSKDAEAPSFF